MKRAERKYTERDVRSALLTMLDQYNLDPENVDSAYAVAKGAKLLRMKGVLKRAWEEGVLKHGTYEAKLAYINAWTFPAKGGAHAAEVGGQTYFTPTETKLFLAACNMCGRQGFYIAAAMLQDLMCDVLKSKTARAPRGTEWKEVITIDYVRKWIVKNRVQRYKNSGLDTKRAEKATEALRDEWFGLIRRELQRLADEAVLPKELAKFEAWPADCKYNVDEDAANAVKKRDCALMSVNPHADGMGRCFGISADGEKMASHVTDVMCTCCAGTVEAPMVIKTRAGGDNAKEASRKRQLGQEVILPKVTNVDKEGLADESAADEQTLNVCVHTSANGSMTVELFVKWCEHFVDNILKPKGQGPGGKPALLFLDGHASRWSVNALFYLRKNNVFVFCVPSHTTIWSQPNDAGPNASFHAYLKLVVGREGCAAEACKGGEGFIRCIALRSSNGGRSSPRT